jgi:hypothetical protein
LTPERISISVLALLALVLGANYVSATGRFLDANRAYDGLDLSLVDFQFTSVEDPVLVQIAVDNPSETDIEILALNVTLRAGLQSVGGGEVRVNEILPAGGATEVLVDARITDQNVVVRLEGAEISWLMRGEIQVRLDNALAPVWIQFSVRTITP